MIIRPPPPPHICLRCQRSLARRSAPSITQTAFQSTSSNPEPASNPPKENKPFRIRRSSGDWRRDQAAGRLSSGLSEYPLGKLYGHRGHKLRENREDLKLESLGDPAKVIVLRESKYNFYDSAEHIDDQNAEHVDILSQLANERGLVGQKEVDQNITAFKPKEGEGPRTWEDINEIVRVLQEGFTYTQLAKYLESFQQRRNPETSENELVASYEDSLILRATPWMPGVSGIVDHFDQDPLRGYSLQSHTSKQSLIVKILRECWMVELPEVADGIGQFEVQIRGDDLDLISKGSPSRLALLHGRYLAGADESLEVFPSRGVIRATTMRHKRDIVLQILEQEVGSIQRKVIHLGDMFLRPQQSPKKGRKLEKWVERNFNDSSLQELGRLTKTDIVKLPKNNLLISSVENNTNSVTSSRIEVARRLLLTSCNSADRADHSLECEGMTNAPASFVSYPQVEGLNWRDRMRHWMRWATPIPKATDSKVQPVITEDINNKTTIQTHGSEPDKSELSTQTSNISHDSSETPIWWDTQQFTESSALFGSILHSTADSSRLLKPFGSPNAIHTFSTLVPNISQILSKAESLPVANTSLLSDTPITYLTLRFLPNPFHVPSSPHTPNPIKSTNLQMTQGIGAAVLEAFPPIEMHFAISQDNKVPRLKEVLAVVNESTADVMIPSNGVDIRWQDKTTRRLRRLDKKINGLEEFVQKSNLSLHDSRMETPPTLKLPMDKVLCRGEGLGLLGGKNEDSKEVEYLFAGLDIRNTLVFNYKGWRLLYTSIEAGRAGGRRGELKLRPIFHGKVNTGDDFVKAVYDLAHELGGSRTGMALGSLVRKVNVDQKGPLVRNVTAQWGVDKSGAKVGYWAKRLNLKKRLGAEDKDNETLLGDGLWEHDADEEAHYHQVEETTNDEVLR